VRGLFSFPSTISTKNQSIALIEEGLSESQASYQLEMDSFVSASVSIRTFLPSAPPRGDFYVEATPERFGADGHASM
jgi:hypothetical protein